MDILCNDERLVAVENIDSQIENEHRLRYKLATLLVENKRVLDVACGSGYGTNMLSKTAKSVIGVDLSQAAVDYCSNKYQSDNLEFKQMSADELDFPEHSFDVVVSFETIEHLTEEAQKKFLYHIKRVLTKDGLLIMSSPNRDVWSKMINKEDNKHHLHELNEEEFKQLLNDYFENVDFYYQNYIPTTFVMSDEKNSTIPVVFSDNFNGYEMSGYEIALCSDVNIDADFSGLYVPQLSHAYNESELGFVDVSLYCDCGEGYCEDDKLHAPLQYTVDGRVYAEFEMPKNAYALRFDPGERPCVISQFEISDKMLSYVVQNGYTIDDKIVFSKYDPILLIEGREQYAKGEKIVFTFKYEQPDCFELIKQLNTLSKRYLELEKKFFLDGKEVNKQEEHYLQCLKDKDIHIKNVESIIQEQQKVIKEKDIHIQNIESIIQGQQTVIEEKDIHIQNIDSIVQTLEKVIGEKDVHIRNIEALLDAKDVHIQNLEVSLNHTNNCINELQQSISWKITAPLRRIIALVHRRK